MIKKLFYLAFVGGVLYLALGGMNEPQWTSYSIKGSDFSVEFPSPKAPGLTDIPHLMSCFRGKLHYVNSRHGPFKINPVTSEMGIVKYNRFGPLCSANVTGVMEEFMSDTLGKTGGEVISQKDIEVGGLKGKEFVIKASYERSIVSRRIFSVDDSKFLMIGINVPNWVDYSTMRSRYFESFQYIE